jgi:hypothetical protein
MGKFIDQSLVVQRLINKVKRAAGTKKNLHIGLAAKICDTMLAWLFFSY